MQERVEWTVSAGTLFKIFAAFVVAVALYTIRDLVLIVIASVVIATAVEPFTVFFGRYRIPRVISIIFAILALLAAFSVVFYFFLPPLFNEFSGFVGSFPEYLGFIDGLDETLENLIGVQNILSDVTAPLADGDVLSDLGHVLFGVSGGALQTVNALFGGVTSFVLIAVISFYLAVQERGVESFIRLVSSARNEEYLIDLWRRSQKKIGLWMQGQFLLGVIITVLVYLGLTVLGVPYAFLLAIIAGLFEIIPVFGPIIAATPAVIIGFVQGGPTLGLLIVGFYIIIQQFESHLIYPLVVRKVVGVPPLLVILSLIIGFKLAGFLGALISVPFAAALVEFASDMEERKRMEARTAS